MRQQALSFTDDRQIVSVLRGCVPFYNGAAALIVWVMSP
jgi:hypothetical protein